jgi:hypothetical protein
MVQGLKKFVNTRGVSKNKTNSAKFEKARLKAKVVKKGTTNSFFILLCLIGNK